MYKNPSARWADGKGHQVEGDLSPIGIWAWCKMSESQIEEERQLMSGEVDGSGLAGIGVGYPMVALSTTLYLTLLSISDHVPNKGDTVSDVCRDCVL